MTSHVGALAFTFQVAVTGVAATGHIGRIRIQTYLGAPIEVDIVPVDTRLHVVGMDNRIDVVPADTRSFLMLPDARDDIVPTDQRELEPS